MKKAISIKKIANNSFDTIICFLVNETNDKTETPVKTARNTPHNGKINIKL